jgi:serine/threonine protein kinase
MENLDSRADIYSLGATLYQLLTGREVFTGNDHDRILHQQIHDDPDPPRQINPDISANCEALLLGMLAKDRDDRPTDWADAITQINRVLDNRHPTGEPHREAAPAASSSRPKFSRSRNAAPQLATKVRSGKRITTKGGAQAPPAQTQRRRSSPYNRPAASSDSTKLMLIIGTLVFGLLLILIIAAS